jgi:hypothetical protein
MRCGTNLQWSYHSTAAAVTQTQHDYGNFYTVRSATETPACLRKTGAVRGREMKTIALLLAVTRLHTSSNYDASLDFDVANSDEGKFFVAASPLSVSQAKPQRTSK